VLTNRGLGGTALSLGAPISPSSAVGFVKLQAYLVLIV